MYTSSCKSAGACFLLNTDNDNNGHDAMMTTIDMAVTKRKPETDDDDEGAAADGDGERRNAELSNTGKKERKKKAKLSRTSSTIM